MTVTALGLSTWKNRHSATHDLATIRRMQQVELVGQRQLLEAKLQRYKQDWLEFERLQQLLPVLQASLAVAPQRRTQ